MGKRTYTREEWALFQKHSRQSSPLYEAKALGVKHRNYGNPPSVNPYDVSDPCHQAYIDGWNERDRQLNHPR